MKFKEGQKVKATQDMVNSYGEYDFTVGEEGEIFYLDENDEDTPYMVSFPIPRYKNDPCKYWCAEEDIEATEETK